MHVCRLLNDSASLGTSAIQSSQSWVLVFCPAHDKLNEEGVELLHWKYLLREFNHKSQLLTKDITNVRSTSSFRRALFSGHLAIVTLSWLCCYFSMVLMCSWHISETSFVSYFEGSHEFLSYTFEMKFQNWIKFIVSVKMDMIYRCLIP